MNIIGKTRKTSRLLILTHAFVFVAGFGFVFVVGWGGAATLVGNLFSVYKDLIAKVGGLVVILFWGDPVGYLPLVGTRSTFAA